MATLIQMVAQICAEIGAPVPDTVVGSTAATALQHVGLANRAIERIATMHQWSALIMDYTFTTVIGTAAYPAPADFGVPIDQTQWDSSLRRPLVGPVNPQAWQYFKQYAVSGGVYPRFRIRGSILEIDPTPTTADVVVASYISKFGVVLATPQTIGGVTYQNGETFASDNDSVFCAKQVFELELKWRFLRAKGLDYAEEMADSQAAMLQAWTRDGGKPIINMGDVDLDRVPNTIPGSITPPP